MESYTSVLQTWLNPLTVSDFLEQYWTRDFLWAPPNSTRLRSSQNILPSLDLPVLLEYALEPIAIQYIDSQTPVNTFQLSRAEAFHAYRAGLTLYFHFNRSLSAALIEELSRELGRPPFMMKVSAFASRKGYTLPHIDGNENFTVQLQGTKRWRVSSGVEWPGVAEKQQDTAGGLPHDLFPWLCQPDHWNQLREYEMSPGAFMYCPSRFWHSVEATEPSLSLNVSITASYTWAEALLPVILRALTRKLEWRQPAAGLWSPGPHRIFAEKMVQRLLKQLSEDLTEISEDDVLAAWDAAEEVVTKENLPIAFIRNPFVSCQIRSMVPGSTFRVRITSTVRSSATYELTLKWDYWQRFLTLIGDQRIRRTDDYADVIELVSELLQLGVLRACPLADPDN